MPIDFAILMGRPLIPDLSAVQIEERIVRAIFRLMSDSPPDPDFRSIGVLQSAYVDIRLTWRGYGCDLDEAPFQLEAYVIGRQAIDAQHRSFAFDDDELAAAVQFVIRMQHPVETAH